MKIKLSTMFGLLVCHLLLLSCTTTESEPPVNLENEYTNQQIKLLTPNQFNDYETISPVVLEVQYYANTDIVFPNNYNVRIFQHTDQGWIEIPEKPVTRLPEDDIVFSAENETTAIRLFTVYLDLDDYSQSYALRFYIFGDMKVDDGTRKVTGYVDVKLNP